MMNSEMCSSHFESAWERIKQVTGWTDYKELAQFVGSTSQSISGIKKRGKFPLEWAHKIAKEFGSYTDYLMDGEGEMRRDKGEATAAPLDNDLLEKALKMVRNLARDVPIGPEQEAKLLGDAYKGFYEVKYKGKEDKES